MNRYDVVVIGAGNGGLSAAATVLNSGKSCLLCEKHNLPGGFATSFVRGRFEFEASLHEFNGIGTVENPGSSRQLFDKLGVSDKIEWIQLKDAYRLICEKEGYDFTMPFGKEAYIKACGKLVEGGEEYMTEFFALCEEIKEAMDYLSASHGKPDPSVMVQKYPNFLRCGAYSLDEVLNVLSMPQILKDNIKAYWCYLGADGQNMTFLHYINMMYKYIEMGAAIPKSRSHEISLAFDQRIRELGGDIFYNTEVKRILTDKEGKVCGVELSGGRIIETKHVIANCSPHVVYGKLLDKEAVPVKAVKLANASKFAGRGFVVFLGLNKSPEELGIKDHSYFIYSTADTEELYKEMSNFEENSVQATVCLNIADKECSPKGTSILYMTTLFTSDVWGEVKEEDYFQLKNKVAQNIIRRFEKATGVKLQGNIEEIAIATPETYARYCSHPQGVIYGYESQPNDGMMVRTMMVNEDCCVKGLRTCGGFGERLLGYPSSYKSGANQAQRTIAEMEAEK